MIILSALAGGLVYLGLAVLGAPAPPRQRGGLARGRAPFDRRAQVLPLELADRDAAKNPRRHHQGALALRAGPSAAQGGTWPRSLRRAILERSASPRSHEYGRLPLSAAPATRSGETGKKQDRPAASAEPTRDT